MYLYQAQCSFWHRTNNVKTLHYTAQQSYNFHQWPAIYLFVHNEEVTRITKQPNLTAIIQSRHCMYGWWHRCHDDPNSFPTRELEETTRASPYHVAEYHVVRPESLQPHTEWSSWPGSEPSSVEADVYGWRYALLVVHARKEEEEWPVKTLHCHISTIGCNALCHMDTDFIRQELPIDHSSRCMCADVTIH